LEIQTAFFSFFILVQYLIFNRTKILDAGEEVANPRAPSIYVDSSHLQFYSRHYDLITRYGISV
jgi:hypothetical protein